MYKKFIKRILDTVLATIILVILLPLFLIVSILIKIDSKGPVFFLQERTGKNNKNFKIFKFRTMKVETKKEEVLLTHDERITKIGSFIRKTSIDELPQIINILKGEMSFIGPRPWIIEYTKYFTDEQMKRLDVLPGITGLAQATGRNNLNVFDKINYDIEYTKKISFITDIKVIIGTIKTVFKADGAEIKQEEMYNEINELKNQFKDINQGKENSSTEEAEELEMAII